MHFDYAQYKQKGFAPIIIILLIALGIGGYFVYNNLSENARVMKEINESLKAKPTPTSSPADETTNPDLIGANWKTYTNTKYKFSFNYPADWSEIESKAPGNPYLAVVNLGPAESIQSGGMIGITVRNQTENDYISVLTKEGFQITQNIDISLGVNKATRYKLNKTLESGEKSVQEIVISMKNGVLYEINGGSNLPEQYRNIFDQILSTFKFTK